MTDSPLSPDTEHQVCRYASAAGLDAGDALTFVEDLVRGGVLTAPTSGSLSPAATARLNLAPLARTAGIHPADDDAPDEP